MNTNQIGDRSQGFESHELTLYEEAKKQINKYKDLQKLIIHPTMTNDPIVIQAFTDEMSEFMRDEERNYNHREVVMEMLDNNLWITNRIGDHSPKQMREMEVCYHVLKPMPKVTPELLQYMRENLITLPTFAKLTKDLGGTERVVERNPFRFFPNLISGACFTSGYKFLLEIMKRNDNVAEGLSIVEIRKRIVQDCGGRLPEEVSLNLYSEHYEYSENPDDYEQLFYRLVIPPICEIKEFNVMVYSLDDEACYCFGSEKGYAETHLDDRNFPIPTNKPVHKVVLYCESWYRLY